MSKLKEFKAFLAVTITCRRCKQEKPVNKFYRRSDNPLKHYSVCRDCSKAYADKRRKELPHYGRSRFLKKYGLTLDQYKLMAEQQNHACALCFRKTDKFLVVDHDHTTGQVRALLCHSCNPMLGFAKDDIGIPSMAINYLKKHSGKTSPSATGPYSDERSTASFDKTAKTEDLKTVTDLLELKPL